MPARLHIGTEVFDLPDQPAPTELAESLLAAFQQQTAVSVNVLAGGGTVVLIVNPSGLRYVAVDLEGRWIGFHSG